MTGSMQNRNLLTPLAIPVYLYLLSGYAFFLSVADNNAGKVQLLPVPPTVAALFFLAPFAAFLFLGDLLSRPPLGRILCVIKANSPVLVPFLIIAAFSLGFAVHPGAFWGDGRKWIFLNTYDFAILLFAMLVPLIRFAREKFFLLSLAGLITLVSSIAVDVMSPGTFSVEPMRAAGFPGNSNWAALAVVVLCAATLRYNPTRWRLFDVTVLIIGGFGVFSTLSRSGMANYMFLIFNYVLFTFFAQGADLRKVMNLVVSATVLGTVFFVAVPFVMSSSDYFAHTSHRLTAFLEGKLVDDGSSTERMKAAVEAVQLIEGSPIFGYGTGYTRNMSPPPHNLYLNQWVNNGFPGLLAYLALVVSSLAMFIRRKYWPGAALICAVIFGSCFSHNVLDQRSFLFLLGSLSTVSFFEWRKRAI